MSDKPLEKKRYLFTVILACILIIATNFLTAWAVYFALNKNNTPDISGVDMTETEIFNEYSPITCTVNAGSQAGSGFIADKNNGYLYIVTNCHVIAEALTAELDNFVIRIFGDDNETYKNGEISIVGYSEYADVAVLKVTDKMPKKNRKLLTPPPDLEAETGARVTAIGNFLGEGIEVCGGLVSNPSVITDYGTVDGGELRYRPRMRVSVNINGGFSGSPLINGKGEILGVSVSQGIDGGRPVAGVSYAIPYALAETVIKKAMAEDSGGEINSISAYMLTTDKLDIKIELGIEVKKVQEGFTVSFADSTTELKKDDIIVEIAGIDVTDLGFCSILSVLGNFADDRTAPQSLKDLYTGKNLGITFLRDGIRLKTTYDRIKEIAL